MRKQILDALKAKFQGVSEAILSRVADKLSKTVTKEEEVQTAVDGVSFQQVLESYGDSRATEAQQTAVANYEKKHGLKDGKKKEEPAPKNESEKDGKGGEDVPSWAQTLIDTNKALNERINQMEADRTTTSRRQQLDALLENLPENLKKAYSRTPLEGMSDDDFKTMIDEITTEVGDITSDLKQKGAVFGKPTANHHGGKGTNELTKEQLATISHREGVTDDNQQPF